MKFPGRKADNLPQFRTKVKNTWHHMTHSLIPLHYEALYHAGGKKVPLHLPLYAIAEFSLLNYIP
jgi:hypothetical protein